MAPANGGANPRKGPASKPRAKNPVIPAIPAISWPHMQRRAPSQTQTSGATTQQTPSQTGGDTQATPKGTPAKPARVESPRPVNHSNGTSKVEGADRPNATKASSAQVTAVAGRPSEPVSTSSTNSTAGDTGPASVTNGNCTPVLDSPKSAPSDEMYAPAGTGEAFAPPPPPNAPPHVPAPFHPGGSAQDVPYGGDVPHGARPSHQPHPSNTSLHFGGFYGSNSSSPAPHSAGYAPPPPGLPLPNGRSSHMGRPSGPDFRPRSMGYGNEFEPTPMDPYGQPMGSHTPRDGPHDSGYPPYMGNYVSSTPHSFHGSQSSAHPDDMYGQFSPHGPPTNGTHGQTEDIRGRMHASGPMMGMHPPLGMMPPMPPPHMIARMLEPDPDQFFAHFKKNFQDPRFADCTLELRFPDNRAHPTRIPAHRLVLSRSNFLEQLMVSDHVSRRKGPAANTVTVTADDKYLRVNGFITALQRLYGFPLFSIPNPPPGLEDLPLAGGAADQFSFVVSYAAAGHLLQCISVVLRGMEMAVQLLCWDTLEPALEFALGASKARGMIDLHERYPYGDPTRILLDGIVGFTASRITTDFKLDASVADPKGYGRLPEIPESPNRPANAKRNSPAIARGTSVHMAQGRRSRLTSIKFGDISVEGSNGGVDAPNGTAAEKQTQGHTCPQIAALSRVLLNLPFGCLKAVLESPRFGLDAENSEANDDARRRVALELIAERESRRLAAVEAVKTGCVPKADGARRVLSSVEPRTTDEWGILGFQEAVVPASTMHSSHLSRAWIPLAGFEDTGATGGAARSGLAYP